ncbi:uncharacterized protein FFFS_04528 [Fusarium fujikuroi]|nr:uncharacterized protein FFC1_04871 [Fusarium fujikuroi]SCV34963.1 uncharacterized protein FFFS_04528 [Fusarium fujikuroi]
MQEKAPKEAP